MLLEAVVELADHAVKEVAQGGDMPVRVVVAALSVVRFGTRRRGQGGERPEVSGVVESVILTQRRVMADFLPEALVMGEEPA